MFKMSAFSVDTGWQTTPPLVYGVVHNRLVQFAPHGTVRCAHKSGDVINFIIVACRISSRLKWYKNYKNRLRLAKVIVKNKMSRFLWFSVYINDLPYTIFHCIMTSLQASSVNYIPLFIFYYIFCLILQVLFPCVIMCLVGSCQCGLNSALESCGIGVLLLLLLLLLLSTKMIKVA